jgi:cysteine desulfurase
MGYVDTTQLGQALEHYGARVAMVSIIFGQNEVGTLQPITYISQLVHSKCPAAIMHTDATQIFGKDYLEPKILGVDMMTGSAHKFHGPRGVGILYARDGIVDAYVTPMTGGGQEHGCRSGTENVPAIIGAAVAFKESLGNRSEWQLRYNTVMANRNHMLEYLRKNIPGLIVNGDPFGRSLPNTLGVSFPGGVHGHMMSEYLDKQGIAIGSGSACSKGKPSESLQAMYGLSKQSEAIIHNTIRISLTVYTSRAECDYAASQIVNGWKTINARRM